MSITDVPQHVLRCLTRESKRIIDEYELTDPDVQRLAGIESLDDLLRVIDDCRQWDRIHPERLDIFNKSIGRCYYCGVELGTDFHVDHFIAKSRGGSNNSSNLVPSCPRCNMSKSNLDLESFRNRAFGNDGGSFWFETIEGIYILGGSSS